MKKNLIFLKNAIFFIFIVTLYCTSQQTIILATTTSVYDSGILEQIIPLFEKEKDIKIKVIAVGSGKALELGRRGEVDIILSHAPQEEEVFLKEGYGTRRLFLMKNNYVVLGPKNDPACIRNANTVLDAFRSIAKNKALFISRGDGSGTHQMERKLWEQAGILPDGEKWYQETGLGMGETISIASEKGAYTLCDRATWIVMKKNCSLTALWERATLTNIYSLIEVSGIRFPHVRAKSASLFFEYMRSSKAQRIIASFGKNSFGEPLFEPINDYIQK